MRNINTYEILNLFGIRDILKVFPINTGHINRTYLAEDRTGKYILQSLNRKVFRSPEKVMNNIRKIEQVFKNSGESRITVPHYLTADGESFIEVNGEVWRVYEYTEQSAFTENRDYLTGYAFGRFVNIINSENTVLETTIENFHDFNKYHDRFMKLSGTECHDELKKTLSEVFTSGLPLRNVHNDAKTDNIIFGEKMTIIDLDTSMKGFAAFDYGDMIRSCDITSVESVTRGFADGLDGMLTADEINSLYYGILYVTGELALRYAIDTLADERYFITKTAGQCRKRAEELVSQLDYFQENSVYIKNVINKAF